MDFLNKTLFTNSLDELKNIYDEELKKLGKNELVLNCLSKLSIQDFKVDIPEESKKRIENALLAVRIDNFIELGDCETLLGLDEFKISNINLAYSEQKMIKEKVEELVKNELKRRKSETFGTLKKIDNEQKKFIELEEENRKLMLKLEQLKREELNLMKEITDVFIGSDQKEIIRGLKQDTEILEIGTKKYVDLTEYNISERTKYSHNVLKEISSRLDELIERKHNES